MKLRSRLVLLLVVATLSACGGGGQRFADAAASLPPIPAGQARLFFYRDAEPYESLNVTAVSVDGREVGAAYPGSVFYRDVPPGSHHVTVRSEGLYPNQFKTVVVEAAQSWFMKIESLRSWGDGLEFGHDTFIVTIKDPAMGRTEIQGLRMSGG